MIWKDAGFVFIIIVANVEKKVRCKENNQEQKKKSGHVSSLFLKKKVFKDSKSIDNLNFWKIKCQYKVLFYTGPF